MGIDTTPLWTTDDKPAAYPKLSRDLVVDAVVIGGGMTGVTAAYLLKAAGLTVALGERGTCGEGETAHTTAHLSAVTDRMFTELVAAFGQERAEAVWNAGFTAIAEIEAIVRREQIECGFRRVPAYLHASLDAGEEDEANRLKEEAAAVSNAGFDAVYLPSVPGLSRPGVRFGDQAIFQPLKYLHALMDRIPGKGSHVFEQSPVDSVSDAPLSVVVGPTPSPRSMW